MSFRTHIVLAGSIVATTPFTVRAGCSSLERAVNPAGCAANDVIQSSGGPSIPSVSDLVPGGPARIDQIGNDVIKTSKTIANETVKELRRTGGDVIKTVENAHEEAARTVLKGARDIEATYIKAWHDTARQTEKDLREVANAAKAVAHYTSSEFQNQQHVLSKSAKQLQDGKIIDAMWTTTVEKAHGTEDNFFQATQESALISVVAQAAAATYGGPAGAAAYAAWATYKATGDVNMALRAGAIAALSTQTGSGVDKMPTGTMGQVLKKSVMAGAAGGVAVAAAGGDEKAVKEAFLKSAGNVLIQGGQDRLQAYSPKAKNVVDTVQCISAKNTECFSNLSYVRDGKGRLLKSLHTEKLDPKQYVGTWSKLDPNSPAGKAASLVTEVSKLPKSQMIPMLNNEWVMSWTLDNAGTIEANTPTVVLTYVGKNGPFKFDASYKRINETTARRGRFGHRVPGDIGTTTHFRCQVPHGATRQIVVTTSGPSCEALYHREREPRTQVIYKTTSHSTACATKADEFMAMLGRSGIACRPGQ